MSSVDVLRMIESNDRRPRYREVWLNRVPHSEKKIGPGVVEKILCKAEGYIR